MTEGGWLTTGRKLQLKIIFYGILLGAATYAVIGLLNGFQYANHLIGKHPIPILLYTTGLFALGIPFYRKNDEPLQKFVYQISWFGAILLIPAASSSLYYYFHPPTTGIGQLTYTISKILVLLTPALVAGAIVHTKTTSSEN